MITEYIGLKNDCFSVLTYQNFNATLLYTATHTFLCPRCPLCPVFGFVSRNFEVANGIQIPECYVFNNGVFVFYQSLKVFRSENASIDIGTLVAALSSPLKPTEGDGTPHGLGTAG